MRRKGGQIPSRFHFKVACETLFFFFSLFFPSTSGGLKEGLLDLCVALSDLTGNC